VAVIGANLEVGVQGPEKEQEGWDGGYTSNQRCVQTPMKIQESRPMEKPAPHQGQDEQSQFKQTSNRE